ncbi:MAG: hypothetical protein K8R58_09665 [Bacteroidales bacterium]|nr:hypothetical protein [Bacteroidales bacterium]
MKKSYLCPKCRSQLKITDYIILSAKTEKGNAGLLLFTPQLGDYTIIKHPLFNFEEGEHIDFFCPVCSENLSAADINKNLAEVIMIDEKNHEYKILFSEIAGQKCTYKIKNDDIEAFGEDALEYTNFWGVNPKY